VKLWCEHAWLGGAAAVPGVLLEIAEGRIGSVSPGVPAEGERLPGLTLPGLANAHSHAFQRALRGRTQVGTGSFWTWREQMYELASSLDPDAVLKIARATFGEMALAGITCVGEFHYVHHNPDGTPYDDPNELGRAVIAAAAEAGIRITLIDACYLHGGIARFRDASVEAWMERVSALGADTRVGAAIHSVRAVDPASAAAIATWAGDRPLHAHVSEQTGENDWCAAEYGMTPTAVLAEAGALSPAFTAVHATHLTENDIALLHQATVCLCPTTERDLADGIGPAQRFGRLATGSDSQAVIDPFEEARAIELDERLATGVRGVHTTPALLAAATNHAAIGWPEAGRLEPGALADLVTVSLDSVRTAGGTDPLATAVFAATATDVRDVMVGGAWIVRGGAHATLDVAAELRAVL
jgi:formiminoglutamate deiminase